MVRAKDQLLSEFKDFLLFVEGSQHLNNGIKEKPSYAVAHKGFA
jgi:hypothetical protein